MLDVSVCGDDKANEWNSLVDKVPSATAYHLWEWGKMLSDLYGYKRYYLATFEKDQITGAFPLVHIKSRLFGNRLSSLPFCEYGGPIADPALNDQNTQEVLKSLLSTTNDLAKKLKVEHVEMRDIPLQTTQDLVNDFGYCTLQRYMTFKVDLTRDLDEIWAELQKDRTRKSIKKAVKSNVETKEIDNPDQLASYFSLYLKSTKRLGSPPHKYELFKKLFEEFKTKGKAKILMASYKGMPIGGLIVFCYANKIFDWNSVTDHEHRSLNSHNLLLWNAIEWGATHGYHTLDLGRTRKGTPIYDFKSGWGGTETKLSEYIYFLNSKKKEPADTMQRKYRYLSKAWSVLPSGIARRIGPWIIGGIAL